jgi:Bacterial SH3 domain
MTTERQPTVVRRRVVLALLVVTVVLAGVAVGLLASMLLGASSGPPATRPMSSKPTGSLMQTASPSAASVSATPTAEPTGQPLEPDTIALVTVNQLNLREEPTTSATSLGHLSTGDRVFVLEGPTQADGYGWYRVASLDELDRSSECTLGCPPPLGWAAVISGPQDSWLMPAGLACPLVPKRDDFAQLAPLERLACYGHQTMTLEGVVWEPCCWWTPYLYEPSWLQGLGSGRFLSAGDPLRGGGLALRFDPSAGLPVPEYADIVRVTGHLDDSAAPTCTVKVDESQADPTIAMDPAYPAYAPIGCRTEFVVDSIDIEGNTGETCGC